MRLFKYLVISNDLIDSNVIYMLNPNEKRKIDKKDRKVTLIDHNNIEDYSNSRMVEVLYNREYKYAENQIVAFQNRETKYTLPLKYLDKIKDESRDEVKRYIKDEFTDAIRMTAFKEEALLSINDKILNKKRAENMLLCEFVISKLKNYGYTIVDIHNKTNKVVENGAIIFYSDKRHERYFAKKLSLLNNSTIMEKRRKSKKINKRAIKEFRKKSREGKIVKKLISKRYLYKAELLPKRIDTIYKRLLIYEDSTYDISSTSEFIRGLKNYILRIPHEVIYENHDLLPFYMDNMDMMILDITDFSDKYSGGFIISHKYKPHENILISFNRILQESRKELINSENYLLKRSTITNQLNKQTKREKYLSYFVNKRKYDEKKRYIRSRINNRFYLFKPYKEKPAIALMDFRYSNTRNKLFKKYNKAYTVIDNNKIEDIIKLVVGNNFENDAEDGKGYRMINCPGADHYCTKGESCIEIGYNKFLGNAWSTVHSSKGTKRIEKNDLFHDSGQDLMKKKKCYDYIEKMQPRSRKSEEGIDLIAVNSDGIITTMASFYKNRIKKTVMTLHQWLKCSSISGMQSKNAKSKIVHVGHTFDNRSEYLERLPRDKVEALKENERKTKVYRSGYVTVGASYFSNTFECNCSSPMGSECKYCEGVLYLNSEQGLKELYDQLTSKEYDELKKNIY